VVSEQGGGSGATTPATGADATGAATASSEPVHPGPLHLTLPAGIARQLVDHARGEYPNEACGLVVGERPAAEGGRALRFEPTRNAAASPYRYEIDSRDLLRITLETDDRDEVFWAIVHSHVRTAARPSPTDVGLALYPEALYMLVALAEAPEAEAIAPGTSPSPFLRAWRILDGRVWEVDLDLGE
jgi:proteasome lid subunit RPN8/RPN11